jgi:hypothetical protein
MAEEQCAGRGGERGDCEAGEEELGGGTAGLADRDLFLGDIFLMRKICFLCRPNRQDLLMCQYL